MNKSSSIRLAGLLLLAFPVIFTLTLPVILTMVLLIIWVLALILYFYPRFFSTLAMISHNSRGQESYLKWMSLAYRSRRINPESAATYSYILLRSGNLEKAADVLEYAEKRAAEQRGWRKGLNKFNHVHSYRALILWKQGKLDEAADLLNHLLLEGYVTSTLYANLGWFLIKQGKFDEALKINLEALDYDRSTGILDNVGLNYLELGELHKSREIYTELVDLNPKFPDAWFNYGRLLEKEGNKTAAREMFQKALSCEFTSLGTLTKEEVELALK